MTPRHTLPLASITLMLGFLLCCKSKPHGEETDRSGQIEIAPNDAEGQILTVIIALSSVVPGGIVGHAGLAINDDYYDFGPKRTKLLQPIKSIKSKAGPWWDDPEQQWTIDRKLDEVMDDMPDKVHPQGSLVAIIRAQVTKEQAQAITSFWRDTYIRMQEGEDTYRLTARQCASMVAWSLDAALSDGQVGDRLPRDLHMITPTRLYVSLSTSLTHTAGPDAGEPAEVALWQLGPDGFRPWQREGLGKALNLPEMPRIRLALERFKHLPIQLLHPR